MTPRASDGPRGLACDGFTLVEALVAAAVTLVALALAVSVVRPAGAAAQALPEALDAQQRLRIALSTLADDIAAAGAGPLLGWGAAAVPTWPAVLPCRWTGGPLGSLPGGCARDDAITLITVAAEAPQALVTEASSQTAPIRIGTLSACELTRTACRFDTGARALLIDGAGGWDLVGVTAVSADGMELGHAQDPLARSARPGMLAAAATVRVYSVRADPDGGLQLRRGSGASSDAPVADQLTGLSFAYLGDPRPPALLPPSPGGERWATYGPVPPPIGVDDTADAWPAGENCVFRVIGGAQVSRMDVLAPGSGGLADLPLAALSDGPWCPDEQSPNRWDADLLRVRLISLRLGTRPHGAAVRAGAAAGPSTGLFDVHRWVPDMEVRIDVALRSRTR